MENLVKPKRSCETCYFFVAAIGMDDGICRECSPIPMLIPIQNQITGHTEGISIQGMNAPVRKNYVCGKHRETQGNHIAVAEAPPKIQAVRPGAN